jgi:hypothetical protein
VLFIVCLQALAPLSPEETTRVTPCSPSFCAYGVVQQ